MEHFILTDPVYYQDCDNCKYAYECTASANSPCPIGGPYYEVNKDEDIQSKTE